MSNDTTAIAAMSPSGTDAPATDVREGDDHGPGPIPLLARRWPTAAAVGLIALTYVPLDYASEHVLNAYFAWGVVMSVMAYFIYGSANGALRVRRTRWVQSSFGLGLVTLASISLGLGFSPQPQLAVYGLGAAYLLHGGWDAIHYVRRSVVSRRWAEFCGVVDLLAGLALLLVVN